MAELKQFIQITVTDTVTQSEMCIIDILTDYIDERTEIVRNEVQGLRQETKGGFNGVAQVVETLADTIDENYNKLDKRTTKLEQLA